MKFSATYKIIKKHLKPVAFQHIATLVNAIFFAVILLLQIFKETHEAWFLSIVLLLNIIVGIIQDLRAKVTLEQLQILMAPKIVRLKANGSEENISPEQLQLGDTLKLTYGDVIPTDGQLLSSLGLEINEALLTGESKSIAKSTTNKVLGGSIVTAGSGTLNVDQLPQNSFVSQMTEKIKQYSLSLSPIQRTLTNFIKYMSYLLLAVVMYVVIYGITVHQVFVSIVRNIAALTSTLVPQGLILATTIFFAYGAVKLFQKKVLLQEINATEKLGLIKNLCVDKTGTLTENTPFLEEVILAEDAEINQVNNLLAGYIQATGDKSETIAALNPGSAKIFSGYVMGALPFSSTRKYGLATLQTQGQQITAVLGAPDILIQNMQDSAQRHWLINLVQTYAPQAKRLILLAKTADNNSQPLSETSNLSPLALFVLKNELRPGTKDIISFFQNRGARIRVISGDNPKTVQAIAQNAGIKHTDIIITGPEMENWDEEAFEERVPAYHLFARIQPEQKEKIISQLKHSGFTAMVGDGANDALAIKKADLGIAMFDGAGATRQIAQIVLMNNSFSALPEGVSIAETIITNIELVSSVFFNKIATGLLLFITLASLGYTYPVSPRNDTIIGYFTIWLAIVYWGFWPAHKVGVENNQSFIRRILPFALINGLLTALAALAVFALSPLTQKTHGSSNVLVVLMLIGLEFWFFVLTPLAYDVEIEEKQKKVLSIFAGLIVLFLVVVFFNPTLSVFFDMPRPQLLPLAETLSLMFLFGRAQYAVTKYFFAKKKKAENSV